jgi:hypothetical protein
MLASSGLSVCAPAGSSLTPTGPFLAKFCLYSGRLLKSVERIQVVKNGGGGGEVRYKCYGTRPETRFHLLAKRTSPFKLAGASVQSTVGSRGVLRGSNAGYTMFRGSVKSTGYPLHSPVSPSLPLPCVIVCQHISTGLYMKTKGGLWYLAVFFP